MNHVVVTAYSVSPIASDRDCSQRLHSGEETFTKVKIVSKGSFLSM